MKLKIGLFCCAGALITFAAWLVHVPESVHAQQQVPEKYRDTVAKGLDFLVKHQHADGYWDGDDGKHPIAMTGLVGIALHMERKEIVGVDGWQSERGRHKEHVDKAANWLMQQSKKERDGLIYSEHPSETLRYMEGHGLATMFLSGVCNHTSSETRRKKLEDTITRALKCIARAQSSNGGWYHTSKVEGHDFDAVLPTTIQVQALHSAKEAGIAIPDVALGNGQEYLRTVDSKKRRLSDIIRALPGCFNRRGQTNSSLQREWLTYCAKHYPEARKTKMGVDDIDHFFFAQAQYISGDGWKLNSAALFDDLQASQDKDGGWPSSNGLGIGRVYATALWCIVLQLDNRLNPAICEIELRRF